MARPRVTLPIGLPRNLGFGCWPMAAAHLPSTTRKRPPFLSRAEWSAYRTLTAEKRRVQFLAGRLAAKLAVAALSPSGGARGVRDLASTEILLDTPGGPRLRVDGRIHGGCVSISHSGAWAVALASPTRSGVAVGVDLQEPRKIPPRGLRFFMRPDERPLLRRLGPVPFWALKEAAYKCLAPRDGVALTEIRLHRLRSGFRASWNARAASVAAERRLGPARLGLSEWRGMPLAWASAQRTELGASVRGQMSPARDYQAVVRASSGVAKALMKSGRPSRV